MSYKISKELFEAVMDVKKECYLQDIELIDENKIIYSYLVDEQFQEPRYDEELINDFFFKCKEWAYNKGYIIKTDIAGEWELYNFKNGGIFDTQNSSSEQQAVFNACQWILNNND